MNITEYIRTYWPIFVTICTIAVWMVISDTKNQSRISALEDRADRQGNSIMIIQSQVVGILADVSGMKSKLDGISENVNYIRNRIDRVTQ